MKKAAGFEDEIELGQDLLDKPDGNSVASGVYIYCLDAAGEVFTKRMLMIK